MNFIEQQDILDATNGGLDIIIMLYPDASLAKDKRNHKFKIRPEKTASASLKKATDGNWLVTDFGGDSKPRNGILCYMHVKGIDWPTALKELAAMFQVKGSKEAEELIRPEFKKRPASADDEEGHWSWKIKKSFSDEDIKAVISTNVLKHLGFYSEKENRRKEAYSKIAATFKQYRWHSLESYSLVKNREILTFSSTPNYPMFLIDEGTHQKIYQPRNADKGRRFMYQGTKPKNFIHGLEQLDKLYKAKKEKIETSKNENKEQVDRGQEVEPKKIDKDPRVKELVICTGGSDAINVALLDYQVIWLNSETAKLENYQYDIIKVKCKKIYNLPDIDRTGKLAAHELAMQFLDIYTIELPEDLLKLRDARGNPCKDIRDYFNHYAVKGFEDLLEGALPYRFWEKKPKYEGRGDNRVQVGSEYRFDNVQAYNFLQKNGFYRLPMGDKEIDWEYIKITGNTVSKTDPIKIKEFVKNFLRDRMMDKELRNEMFTTTQLSDTSLSNLDSTDIDFTSFDKHTQFMFFRNKIVKVTAKDIEAFKPGSVNRYIWEEEELPHHLELPKQEPFTITQDSLGQYSVEINNHNCIFLKYLVQTSRVHWRNELEGERWNKLSEEEQVAYKEKYQFSLDGPNLEPDEIEEHKRHLVNKLFTIGYLLHRYKDRSRPWFVYSMDNRISDDGRSHGGSGKSILFDVCMRTLHPKNFYINGRIPKQMEDSHKYDGLTEHDSYVLIEDANEYFRLDILFNDVTGDIKVNPKGKRPFTIPFVLAPKFVVNTNYTARNLDSSTIRRMLYTVFSDYYHTAGETNDYKETRDPASEFGISMITEFDRDQFNDFYNTCLYALKFYLGCTEKIGPTMNNVNKRQLMATMGEGFHDWALTYFSPENEKLDTMLQRHVVFTECQQAVPEKNWTAQRFLEKLKAFCRLYEYTLNPKKYQGNQGKIIQKVLPLEFDRMSQVWREGSEKVTKEMLFIETEPIPIDPEGPAISQQQAGSDSLTNFFEDDDTQR